MAPNGQVHWLAMPRIGPPGVDMVKLFWDAQTSGPKHQFRCGGCTVRPSSNVPPKLWDFFPPDLSPPQPRP